MRRYQQSDVNCNVAEDSSLSSLEIASASKKIKNNPTFCQKITFTMLLLGAIFKVVFFNSCGALFCDGANFVPWHDLKICAG